MSRLPLVVMPDAVAVVTGYLRDALAAVGERVPVVSRVPSTRPARFVRVRRVGGTRQTVVSDRPRLDVHAWAATEGEASDLAELVRAVLSQMPGQRGGVTVYRVTEVGGPMWLPDDKTGSPRYAFAVEIHMRGRVLDTPMPGN
ncbi:hypothetical protein GCM10010329_85140 [Streptomyces spiroverticillatus]|uniref:DUF3168 domain-containing protein n=1 Tax=Streptomyces finlayi TaxID=67296 RepID=A0A918XAI4_9ACTN|nr:DUF3168 domain-containing protein [Streptomyces finlayi]GHA49933.1 hypothetical protein GCM10010329_85140 [Streptomyces spiroverticillatus]GHD19532.1 hypothetical protein GCM10010334_83290 [Streptomyces finlayi]